MLQRRLPFTEILYAILFLNQTLFPEKFTFLSSLLYFLTIATLNWYIDGLRSITFIIFTIQTLFLLTSSTYIHILLLIWTLWAFWFFPVYKSPKPTGKYLVGYKFRSITGPKGPTSMGVYYPTTEKTKDVKYAPTEASWSRFADFMKFFAEAENKRPLAKPAVRVAMNLFERQYLGVNEEATIVKAESQEGFPVVVFSHGLSANIHIYASLLKEWASHGFIVLSMDHDELIYMAKAEYGEWENHLKARSMQLDVRKKTVIKVLDLVYDGTYIQNLFGDNGIKVNPNKIFLAGHSFGGGTVAEVAAMDKRATGALLLLDPWMEACDEKVLTKSVSIPILSLRSNAFDKRPRIKTPVVKHIEANKKNKEGILSGYFKGSGHNSMLDLVLYMPRDMAVSKEIKVKDVGEQMRSHLMLSRIFLQTALEQGGKTTQGENVTDLTLKKFRKVINMVGQPDTLVVDE